jgi:hypothetical protein
MFLEIYLQGHVEREGRRGEGKTFFFSDRPIYTNTHRHMGG